MRFYDALEDNCPLDLCAECADEIASDLDRYDHDPWAGVAAWEYADASGEPLECDGCGCEIPLTEA